MKPAFACTRCGQPFKGGELLTLGSGGEEHTRPQDCITALRAALEAKTRAYAEGLEAWTRNVAHHDKLVQRLTAERKTYIDGLANVMGALTLDSAVRIARGALAAWTNEGPKPTDPAGEQLELVAAEGASTDG